MLPHATASRPPARRHDAISPVVVVLPFVPGHRHERDLAQPRTQLELAPDGDPPLERPTARIGASCGTPGTGHDERRAVEVRRVVTTGRDLDAQLMQARQRVELIRRARLAHQHVRTLEREHLRRGGARHRAPITTTRRPRTSTSPFIRDRPC